MIKQADNIWHKIRGLLFFKGCLDLFEIVLIFVAGNFSRSGVRQFFQKTLNRTLALTKLHLEFAQETVPTQFVLMLDNGKE